MRRGSSNTEEAPRRKKVKTDNKSKVKSKLSRLKFNKKFKLLLACIILALVIVVLISNYTTFGLVLNKQITEKDAVTIELPNTNVKVVAFGDEILTYSKGELASYSTTGKKTWNTAIEGTLEADIKTCGIFIQVVNKDKGIVYVYKNKYETARIKVDGEIYSANINEAGMSVIEYSSTGNKTILGIYSSSGKLKYNVKLSNKMIGGYVLSPDSRYLAYIEVVISGISASTNINVIDLKDSKLENKVVYTNDGMLAFDIYWSGRKLITRFENEYVTYDVGSKDIKHVNIKDTSIILIDGYDEKYALVHINENSKYQLCLMKFNSEKVKLIDLDEAPKLFEYENGLVYICYQKGIDIYNNWGIKIKEYSSSTTITNFQIFNNCKSIALMTGNKLIIFTI